MPIVPSPAERLRHVCAVMSLAPTVPPLRLVSYSNDVWRIEDERIGSVVVRVAWRGDLDRFDREVAVVRQLPPDLRYPEVVDHGRTELDSFPLAYMMTRRLAGRSLSDVWTSLPGSRRHSAVIQTAAMLRELHLWRLPAGLAAFVSTRAGLRAGDITGLLGADITALPTTRAVALARHAMTLPHVDPGLMRDAIGIIDELAWLAPELDDPTRHGLIHGDLQLTNLLWCDSAEICLLDLEWVRFGPPLLDAQRLCENADTDVREGRDTHPTILRWLAEDYPGLFLDTHLAERMRLYSLAYSVRHVIVDPPQRPADQLPAGHALHRVRRLVEGRWPVPGSLPDMFIPA